MVRPDDELREDWSSERGIRSTVGEDGSVYVIREDIFPNAAGRVTASVMAHAPDGTPGDWLELPDQEPTPAVDAPSGDPAGPPPQMRGRLELMAAGIRYHVRPWIRGDTVVALIEDEEGVPFVKRFRLDTD